VTDEPTAPIPSGPRRPPVVIGLVAGCLLVALAAVIVLVVRDETEEPAASTTTTSQPAARSRPISEWRSEVQAGCQEWNRDYAHLEDAEPSTAEEAVEHTGDVDALASGLAGVLTDAGLPEDDREDAEQLVELSTQMAAAADDLATAAASADGTGVDEATERIESLGESINELAESLQVPACGGY
jgi:hypothetical protein